VKPDASPTARVLLVLELIQGSPGITADRLADKLGVSERAARRYVAILREAGISIESVRGPHGGFRIGRGRRLPLVFTADEALGLVMAVLDGHHDASDPTAPVGSALNKMVRLLSEPVAAQIEAVRRTTPAPDRGAARPDPGITTVLVQACASRRRARLDYRSEAGSRWQMAVDPWAVVVRHGRWYLLCHDHRADATRAYRIDRVQGVDPLDETFTAPADLDPVATLEDHLGVGWEYDVEVHIDAPMAKVAPCLPRPMGRLDPLDDQRTRLVGSTSNPYWYASMLTGIPASYTIVRCPELQAAAQKIGERLLKAAGG